MKKYIILGGLSTLILGMTSLFLKSYIKPIHYILIDIPSFLVGKLAPDNLGEAALILFVPKYILLGSIIYIGILISYNFLLGGFIGWILWKIRNR